MKTLLFLIKHKYKEVIIVVLIFAFLLQWKKLSVKEQEIKAFQKSLDNPKIVERVIVKTVRGPVRVVTKVVEKPSGERESLREESIDSEELLYGESKESQPIIFGESDLGIEEQRTSRWLAGVSLKDWSPKDSKAYTAWGGYSFRNRLDVLYGLGYEDSLVQNIMLVGRF